MATKLSIAGNTFLFTGKLTEFTREDAEAHVEAEGGKVLSGVSAKLNYLVVGEDAGSKLAKAEAIGTVTILHEKEFLKMMQAGVKAVKTIPKKAVPAKPDKVLTLDNNFISKKAAPKKAVSVKSLPINYISTNGINDFGNMPFAWLSQMQFKKIYGEQFADYNDYSRIILIISSTNDDLENHKKIIFDELLGNSHEDEFQTLKIAPYHFATAPNEYGFEDIWLYYHSKEEIGYSNDTFRELSEALMTSIKAIDPDNKIYQGYSNGDFDTGMNYVQNEGDFGMWNAWEDFDPNSELNEEYFEELSSKLKSSPIKIKKQN